MVATERKSSFPIKPEEVLTLGIVGGGLMGAGVAQIAAAAGIRVKIYDVHQGVAETAVGKIREHLDRTGEPYTVPNAIAGMEDFADCHAVIEAVVEDIDVKQDVFVRLAEVVSPNTLLATNTSALPVTDIAADSASPENIIGMHFFSPVPKMPLCEIVCGYRTSEATLDQALELAELLGKETIVVNRDDAGFVTSRIMTVLVQEAANIVEQGLATAEDVDRACKLGFGHRMGPLETADLTGTDVALRANRSIYESTGDPRYRPPQLLSRMVSAGALGRKSGEGFYSYEVK